MRVTHTESQSPEQRFGAQVREAREIRGWSQEALARHLREVAGLDLHQTAIARLERGDRAIRLNEAAGLAKLLGIDLAPYPGGVGALTAGEHEGYKELLDRLRAEEREVRDELADVRSRHRDEEQAVELAVSSIRSQRLMVEAAIREYESRVDGSPGAVADEEA